MSGTSNLIDLTDSLLRSGGCSLSTAEMSSILTVGNQSKLMWMGPRTSILVPIASERSFSVMVRRSGSKDSA